MKGMSQRIEQIAGARLSELGSPVKLYHHNRADKGKYKLNPGEHDCLTCRKSTTHIIPKDKRCQAICGNKPIKKTIKIIASSRTPTKTELIAIIKMSSLIDKTTKDSQ